jgi:hypothetical protein
MLLRLSRKSISTDRSRFVMLLQYLSSTAHGHQVVSRGSLERGIVYRVNHCEAALKADVCQGAEKQVQNSTWYCNQPVAC